jgi:hypothetical protein
MAAGWTGKSETRDLSAGILPAFPGRKSETEAIGPFGEKLYSSQVL